ncbi:hypothetical protein LUZ60_010837 [Juncus effusus]|nr:hypothetical protein LUZ60_010837 [Juncus effusus]
MSTPLQAPIYKDPTIPVEARIQDLLSRMTLHEKVGQIAQIERTVVTPASLTDLSVGSVLNGGGSWPREKATTEEWADMVDEMQRWALASRLGIPIIFGTDAVHGHNNLVGATIFPHNVGLGAARDKELIRKIGEVTALEVRASGIHWAFAPCLAVCKDPRWGRCYESYSEDPEIVQMMSCIVSGLQGSPPDRHLSGYPFLSSPRENVLACAKHFVGDGGTHKGINEGNTICSYEELENIHMKPYYDCFDQGVCTVMVSYSSWNSQQLHANRFLVTDVLKNKLNFKGLVVSDWEGIDRLCSPQGSNYRYCVKASINAGIDMIMVPFKYEKFLEDLVSLVESGEIPIARINDAVERILRVKFISGIFEHPFSDRSLLNLVGCKEHRMLAREAVRKSLVLLKNGKDKKKKFLPLDKNAKRILITGSHADNIGFQCGGWTITWFGGSGNITTGTSILQAIREAVGPETEIVYEANLSQSQQSQSQSQSQSSNLLEGSSFTYAIVVVGEEPYAEALGDKTDLSIPFNGSDLISLVSRTMAIPTLVILLSGRPLVLEPDVLDGVEGVVAGWLPGSEGNGVADCVFGDFEFEGVLPVTWFRDVDRFDACPLFPVGFGLRMFD